MHTSCFLYYPKSPWWLSLQALVISKFPQDIWKGLHKCFVKWKKYELISTCFISFTEAFWKSSRHYEFINSNIFFLACLHLDNKTLFLVHIRKNNFKLRTDIIPRYFKNKFNQQESFLHKHIYYNLSSHEFGLPLIYL